MSNRFLILALPRSRTAWLANFLTQGPIACCHEPFAECRTPDMLRSIIDAQGAEFNGASDTFGAFWFEQLKEILDDPKVVVIRRPMDQVLKSLEKLGHPADGLEIFSEGLDAAERDGALSIPFYDLDSRIACQAIQAHVAPHTPFNVQRFEMLRRLNIQISQQRWEELGEVATRNYAEIWKGGN